MKIIVNTVVVLIFFNLMSEVILAQENGWQSLKWGMDLEEVMNEYPNSIKKEKPSRYQDPYGNMKSSPIRLKSYKLVETDFFVDFIFDEDKLVGVVLGADDSISMSTNYNRVVNGLTTRYGEPYLTEKEEEGRLSNIWESEGTQISANYIPVPILNRYSIRLSYWMIDIEQLDRF